jgi:acid phosphatase type 7
VVVNRFMKKITFLTILVGCLVLVRMPVSAATNAAAQAPLPATLLPYLQNPAPDGMTVCFLAQNAAAVTVVLQPTATTSKSEVVATGASIPGTPWTIWKARLTDLKPGGTYAYQVKYRLDGANTQTPAYQFRALDPQAKSVSFAEVNDIHNNVETLAGVMRWVKADDYEFFVLLGDLWANPDASNGAEKIFRCMQDYVRLCRGSEKPILFVRGNHETIGNFAEKLAYLFDQPGLDPTAKFGDQNWFYALKAGPVWLLALDTGDDFTKRMEVFQPIRQRQADWMRDLFARPAGANAAWRILLAHQPLYNDDWVSSEPSRQMWEPVLKNANIDLEINGHEHCLWKQRERGKTYPIEFKGHSSGQQDPQGRKQYTLTPLFPGIIGGGPKEGIDRPTQLPMDGVVKLVTADEKTLQVRLLAAKDGRLLTEFKTQHARQ